MEYIVGRDFAQALGMVSIILDTYSFVEANYFQLPTKISCNS